jgi:hypothetical protein
LGESLSDATEDRHLSFRPLDAQAARRGQIQVFDIVVS